MLIEGLERVANEFVYRRAEKFAQNEFGNFVRLDLAIEARKRLIFLPHDLKVKSSVGAGKWAAVPWLAFFDPIITETATKGFYVVYLINAQTQEISLSLNQGTTEVYREFGETNGREVLKRRAADMRQRVHDYCKNFSSNPIELGSQESLPKGYEAGHAFGRTYLSGAINPDQFYNDLEKMLFAYEALIDRGGIIPSDVMNEEAQSSDITETRKYVLSRRIERSSKVRREVLSKGPIRCQGCGLDPIIHLNYQGRPQNSPLDIHHSKPIGQLREGETRRYKVPDDFMILCPTCHRLIHKQKNSSDLQALRSQIKFKHTILPENSP